MALHEGRCIKNPLRTCGFCKTAKLDQKPIGDLIHAIRDDGLTKLREVAQGCPACMLAGIVQYREAPDGEDEWIPTQDFDYRNEVTKFWEKQNEEWEVPQF